MSSPRRRSAGRRVAFFDDHPTMDTGATRWTRTVAAELGHRGWLATIIFPHEGRAAERAREEGLTVRVVPTPAVFRRYGERLRPSEIGVCAAAFPHYWWRLAAVLRECADLVHVNDHRGLLLAAPAARLVRRPVVWHVHSAHPARPLNRLGSVLAGAVVTPSAAVREACPGLGADVTCLPNAVHSRLFAVHRTERSPDGPPVIVAVGRLHPIKGFDVLLQAVARLRETGVRFRLVVVGGEQAGHEQHAAELRALAARLGLDGFVEFAGAVDDPVRVLRTAAVYVQPSRFEPGGLAVLEAMACGLPVVASDVGGLRETVVERETGWLVPPNDAAALVAALRAALFDTDRACRFGAAGRERARAFTADALADRLEALYTRVLVAR